MWGIQARSDPALHHRYKAEVVEFTNQLIAEGLGTQLMDILEVSMHKLSKWTRSYTSRCIQGAASRQQQWLGTNLSPTQREQRLGYYSEERQLVALCLFFIYYQTTAPANEALHLLKVFREYSTQGKQNLGDADLLNVSIVNLLVISTYLLFLEGHSYLTPDPHRHPGFERGACRYPHRALCRQSFVERSALYCSLSWRPARQGLGARSAYNLPLRLFIYLFCVCLFICLFVCSLFDNNLNLFIKHFSTVLWCSRFHCSCRMLWR